MTNSLSLSTKLLRLNCVSVTVIDVDGHAKRNITKKATCMCFFYGQPLTKSFNSSPEGSKKCIIFCTEYSIVSFVSHSV